MKRKHEAFRGMLSQLLNVALDPEALVGALVELAVPELASFCLVAVCEKPGQLRRAAECGELPAQFDTPTKMALQQATRSADAVFAPGKPCWVVLPLIGRGELVGAVVLVSPSEQGFSRDELVLAEELARLSGVALHSALLLHKLKGTSEARAELLAVVSHELKNPLTSIDLQAQYLELQELPETEHERVTGIRVATQRMRHLVNDLLEVDKLETGRLAVQRRPEPLTELVREAVELMRPLASEKKIPLELQLPAESRQAQVDPVRISQVVSNVLGNAIKFTEAERPIEIGLAYYDRRAEIVVRDHGVGMSQEALHHIFDRYWQDQKTAHLGSGLGLFIAKGLVDLHGGKIDVESAPGRGTKVRIELPL